MALSGDTRTQTQVNPEAFGVVRVPPPYAYRCTFGTDSAAACGEAAVGAIGAAIDAHSDQGVAAVLMEANAGTNGIVAPPNFWPRLREETRARGVYLIADEVMSGFGRCGEWFAWQQHGEAGRPDLMTLAKGLTGAHLPLGAVVLSAEVAARLEHEMLYTGLTYCGHPLSCAAGVAAVQAYADEALIERSRALGRAMFEQLQGLARRHAVIGDLRGGDGLFAVVELVADRGTKALHAPWPSVAPPLRRLVARAMEAGVSLAVRGNLIILAPPLVIAERDLHDAIDLVDRLLAEFDEP
jgi:taurine--2-oxoglutarate transaminase